MNEEAKMEFIEDLLNGEVGQPETRDVEKQFGEDSELRRMYVNQQFVHALLISRQQMRESAASEEEKIKRVMNAIDAEEMKRRKTKSNLSFVLRLSAAAAVVVTVVTVLMFLPSSKLEAEAVIEDARQKSFEEIDRTYSLEVRISHLPRASLVFRGFLYVRGADKAVMELELPQGKIVRGTDGEKIWLIPPRGPIFVLKERKVSHLLDPEADELPQLYMERLMAQKEGFETKIVSDSAKLEGREGERFIVIESTPLPGRETLLKKAVYWVDRNSKFVVCAEILFGATVLSPREKNVKIEFLKEETRDISFYKHETHNVDKRPLFDGEKLKELLRERASKLQRKTETR
ncbi:MAG: hypothetical protein N2234_06660 [Planctomycetota bacterium]|nr:hypothetical protein [Planctomycetota bacterium]